MVAHINYSVDQVTVHGNLKFVWERVCEFNDRDQTEPRAIPT